METKIRKRNTNISMPERKYIIICLATVVMGMVYGGALADTIYVKLGSSGDGSSWTAAYGSLQTALDSAEPNDQIWVATGTYQPGGTPFKMKNGVGIYGGFPNTGDPNL